MDKPKLAETKFKWPAALKSRIDKIAKRLSLSTASTIRLALTEFAEKHERQQITTK